jgi:hypothetical protein
MGTHRREMMGGDVLKTQVHLDRLVKQFYPPPHPIAQEDLSRRNVQIGAG